MVLLEILTLWWGPFFTNKRDMIHMPCRKVKNTLRNSFLGCKMDMAEKRVLRWWWLLLCEQRLHVFDGFGIACMSIKASPASSHTLTHKMYNNTLP